MSDEVRKNTHFIDNVIRFLKFFTHKIKQSGDTKKKLCISASLC